MIVCAAAGFTKFNWAKVLLPVTVEVAPVKLTILYDLLFPEKSTEQFIIEVPAVKVVVVIFHDVQAITATPRLKVVKVFAPDTVEVAPVKLTM